MISRNRFRQPMAARNRVGTGLSYWPARLYRLAELIPWNRVLGIDSLESILGLLESLKIRGSA
jgi:hypothetical protein